MLSKRFNQNGKVIILSETTDEPMSLCGSLAGICWNTDTSDPKKNFDRGLDCLRSGHGRVLEFVQIYMVLDGWSARVIREFYTHIAGGPTRLQESTRYVDCNNFSYVVPPSLNERNKAIYKEQMEKISDTLGELEQCGTKREDAAMILPLAMETKVVVRTNLRQLIDMAKVRLCKRAYWEFRALFENIMDSLSFYSDEWQYLVKEEKVFKPKCMWNGYCDEKKSCGFSISKDVFKEYKEIADYCYKNNITLDKIREKIE